ncbi:MAG: tRNA lysidine(34) synthetase TilS [Clostridia bacterium]|nr:tRNA lysidine(34) synthetase TilS [Clostridia bacterium]
MTKLEALRGRMKPLPEGKCLLGLSGGADSVALLHLLLPMQAEGKIDLSILHVNHGLRGAASEADAEFVWQLCQRLDLPLEVVCLDLEGRRDENAAREARHAAFRAAMIREGIPSLILAHQRDDQAETFLMRLLRGAGLEGLGGMRAEEAREGYRILRPLLEISGQELRDALREANIPWREDETNQQSVYFRNRIRLELLPQMEQMAPGAAERLARTAGLLGEENDVLAAQAEAMLQACETILGVKVAPLLAAPDATRSRVLRLWWRRRGPRLAERELSFEQTRRLCGLLEAERGTIINLPGEWRARREKETLRLLDPTNRTKNNRARGRE